MAKIISCEEFQTILDEAIRRMAGELKQISTDELGGAEPEFTFEDWWTHLSQIAVPELLLAEVRASENRRVA